MNIEEIKKKFKDEWVIAEVLKEDELNRPVNVVLIAHSKNRDDIYNALENVENKKRVTTFYTGEIPEKGFAVAFLWVKLK